MNEVGQVVEISRTLSSDITMYVIFISIVFIICFMFLGFQLLNIFKQLLNQVVEEISQKLTSIEGEVKDLKYWVNKIDSNNNNN